MISFFEKNQDKCDEFPITNLYLTVKCLVNRKTNYYWKYLSLNESIFKKYNYDDMKTYFLSTFGKELIEWHFHPHNQNKWKGWGF
jgi:hypothetical protein